MNRRPPDTFHCRASATTSPNLLAVPYRSSHIGVAICPYPRRAISVPWVGTSRRRVRSVSWVGRVCFPRFLDRGRACRIQKCKGQHGVAVIIVLWVVMVLSLLISGFAFTMHVETRTAAYARMELKAQMLARSGIEVARMQLLLHDQSAADAGYDALNQD